MTRDLREVIIEYLKCALKISSNSRVSFSGWKREEAKKRKRNREGGRERN
jgi:hypothetical protein